MFIQGVCKKLFVGLFTAVLSFTVFGGTAAAEVVPVNLTAKKATVKVAQGVKFKAWTFNGTVPGPVVRATEGDTIEVTLKNGDTSSHKNCKKKKKGKQRKKCNQQKKKHAAMWHSIDFHAAKVAPSDAFRSVAPGESFTFSFEASTPGVYLYHCGTGPLLEHVGMGMYGMIVVDPAEGRPPAQEVFLVQSEFYGKVKNGWLKSSYQAMKTEEPTYVAFNGKAARYAQAPIKVPVGGPVRIYFVDAGPSLSSSFHVVGTIFDAYQHDGNPDEPMLDVSTQLVGPGGAGVFELTFPEAGTYPFVTHALRDMDKGAVGIFAAE
ncbi:MAG: multicopper oxidase domain-containing protein [Thermoleophilia bacterium]|nr:multicopper oxidase domain-containing protein [Thermoleophilia bacterium]